jgi:hypothetical protein
VADSTVAWSSTLGVPAVRAARAHDLPHLLDRGPAAAGPAGGRRHRGHAQGAGLAEERDGLLGGRVAARDAPGLAGDDLRALARLGQQLTPGVHDGHERLVARAAAELVLRVEGREPDHLAVAALDVGQRLDGVRVQACDRLVQADAAEHLDAGHDLTPQVGAGPWRV